MNLLPIEYVNKWLEIARESTIFGYKLKELSTNELMAVAAHGWIKYSEAIKKENEKDLARFDDFVNSFSLRKGKGKRN